MLSRNLRRKLAHFWTESLPWLFSALGLAALIGLWYFLANTGPGSAVEPGTNLPAAVTDLEFERKVAEVAGIEQRYKTFEAAGVVSEEALVVLTDAVEKQRAIARSPRYGDYAQQQTLERLEGELATVKARRELDSIERLMRAGEEDQAAMRLAEAEEAYKTALQLQRGINTGSAASRYKNYVREAEIERALVSLRVYPLHSEKEAALVKARKASEEKRWADALAAYTAARDALGKINQDFARTRYANLSEFDRIEAEIASLNAAGIAKEVEQREQAGDAAEREGEFSDAARAYAEALARQQQINQLYGKSRFMSSARIDALEVKLQTVRSQPLAVELARLDRSLGDDLRRRRLVAVDQALPEAMKLTERLATEFPRSRFVDGAIRIKLSYLGLKREDLRRLQDETFDRLLPLIGLRDRLMFGSETSQGLYEAVMNTNPSRNPGRAMPVDSVNWVDAQEFCTRLGWIMGLQVRLPTQEEYKIALGDDAGEVRSAGGVGKVGTTDGGRPNPNGYRDLLGNLAEWLAAPAEATRASLAGGSVLDMPEVISKLPIEERSKTDRARHIGFRFVVELPITR